MKRTPGDRRLETQCFDHPPPQMVFQENVDAEQEAQGGIQGLDQALKQTFGEVVVFRVFTPN